MFVCSLSLCCISKEWGSLCSSDKCGVLKSSVGYGILYLSNACLSVSFMYIRYSIDHYVKLSSCLLLYISLRVTIYIIFKSTGIQRDGEGGGNSGGLSLSVNCLLHVSVNPSPSL